MKTMEEMALPSIEIQHDDDQGERDLVRSIVEFDDADYKSDEDPDFVAPIDVDDNDDDDGSSADDESSSSDEGEEMED